MMMPAAKVPHGQPDVGLPPEMDPRAYRGRYPDLLQFNDAELAGHFRDFGASEGRHGSLIGSRAEFFALIGNSATTLEIGPLANPSVRGQNVRYFDVLGTDALRQKASSHQLNPDSCPAIDYVSNIGDLSVVSDCFDAVVSSHAIEHQPDLIQHLFGVARILKPAGRYFLAAPDKRYCFDHFIAESTIADVLDAHTRESRLHNAASIIKYQALRTHNEADRHWRGDHGAPIYKANPERLREALETYLNSAGAYLDTHAWQFTPESFRDMLQVLHKIEFSPFRVLRVYPTLRGALEFYAVLEKVRDSVPPSRVELPADFDEGPYLLANPDVAAANANAQQHYLSYGHREGRKLRP